MTFLKRDFTWLGELNEKISNIKIGSLNNEGVLKVFLLSFQPKVENKIT